MTNLSSKSSSTLYTVFIIHLWEEDGAYFYYVMHYAICCHWRSSRHHSSSTNRQWQQLPLHFRNGLVQSTSPSGPLPLVSTHTFWRCSKRFHKSVQVRVHSLQSPVEFIKDVRALNLNGLRMPMKAFSSSVPWSSSWGWLVISSSIYTNITSFA